VGLAIKYQYKDIVIFFCPLNNCIHIIFKGTACNELFPGLEIDPLYLKCLKLYPGKMSSPHPFVIAPRNFCNKLSNNNGTREILTVLYNIYEIFTCLHYKYIYTQIKFICI